MNLRKYEATTPGLRKGVKLLCSSRFEMKIVKSNKWSRRKRATRCGKPAASSIVDYARKVAASKQRSLKLAQKAKIVTKSGQLTAHYK